MSPTLTLSVQYDVWSAVSNSTAAAPAPLSGLCDPSLKEIKQFVGGSVRFAFMRESAAPLSGRMTPRMDERAGGCAVLESMTSGSVFSAPHKLLPWRSVWWINDLGFFLFRSATVLISTAAGLDSGKVRSPKIAASDFASRLAWAGAEHESCCRQGVG